MTRFLAIVAMLCLIAIPAQARDGWQDHAVCDPALYSGAQLDHCHEWIAAVRQHDNGVSCCGDGDAAVVDRSFTADGNFYVVIQGKQYLVPPNKVNDARTDGGANPTGQEIGFISGGEIVCYFGPAGT